MAWTYFTTPINVERVKSIYIPSPVCPGNPYSSYGVFRGACDLSMHAQVYMRVQKKTAKEKKDRSKRRWTNSIWISLLFGKELRPREPHVGPRQTATKHKRFAQLMALVLSHTSAA